MQVLLTEKVLKGSNNKDYFETVSLPSNFLAYKRIDITAEKDNCVASNFKIYLIENANLSMYLSDAHMKPSFEWRETLVTQQGNTLRIYTNGEFKITKAILSYYRLPTPVTFAGCADISKEGLPTLKDTPCEFKDTITEKLIDEAAGILAADMESWNQYQRNTENSRT